MASTSPRSRAAARVSALCRGHILHEHRRARPPKRCGARLLRQGTTSMQAPSRGGASWCAAASCASRWRHASVLFARTVSAADARCTRRVANATQGAADARCAGAAAATAPPSRRRTLRHPARRSAHCRAARSVARCGANLWAAHLRRGRRLRRLVYGAAPGGAAVARRRGARHHAARQERPLPIQAAHVRAACGRVGRRAGACCARGATGCCVTRRERVSGRSRLATAAAGGAALRGPAGQHTRAVRCRAVSRRSGAPISVHQRSRALPLRCLHAASCAAVWRQWSWTVRCDAPHLRARRLVRPPPTWLAASAAAPCCSQTTATAPLPPLRCPMTTSCLRWAPTRAPPTCRAPRSMPSRL